MFEDFDMRKFVLSMAVLILAITVHEFFHAITADRLGDTTPRRQGRLTLFPTDHLDPLGTVMMVVSSLTGMGFGWGKPVMTSPSNFRKPIRDGAIVAIAGPISNLLQAVVFAVIMHFTGGPSLSDPVGFFIFLGVYINLTLAFFNLLPIGPLDGHWIIQAVMPREQADAYYRWNLAYGGFIFIGLMLFAPRVVFAMIDPAITSVMRHLVF